MLRLKRKWAIEQQKKAAYAAKNLGLGVVCGFTGSPIRHMIYSFPPVSDQMIEDGFKRFCRYLEIRSSMYMPSAEYDLLSRCILRK